MTQSSLKSPAVQLPVDENRFVDWRADAKPGDRLVYHRGLLASDRCAPTSQMSEPDRLELIRVADRALQASEGGLVHLVQLKHGPEDFSYIAVARMRSRPTPTGAARVRKSLRADMTIQKRHTA